MHSAHTYWPAAIVPFVIISTVYGANRILRFLESSKRLSKYRVALRNPMYFIAIFIFLNSITTTWLYGPFGRNFSSQLYKITEHHKIAAKFVNMLPNGSSISAEPMFLPHLSHRGRTYLFPTVLDAEYILLDPTSTYIPAESKEAYKTLYNQKLREILTSGEFKLIAREDNIFLFRKVR
jgi:hypothetical protein